MKKILFFIGSLGGGGAERVITVLANSFVDKEYDVGIVTIDVVKEKYEIDNRVSIYSYNSDKKSRIRRVLGRIPFIRKTIKAVNPDICISFLAEVNIYTIIASLGLNVKLIVSERNDPRRDPDLYFQRFLRDKLYKYTDGIVFQTEEAKNYFDGIVPDKIKKIIIANPLKKDLPYYKANNVINEFITACRLTPQKNLKLMIDSMTDVINDGFDCTLKIYGEGSLKQELQDYIQTKKMEKKIIICNFSSSINQIMSCSTCFLITSDYEGMSNSMLEALAIGVPVIATDCPVGAARKFVINNYTGHLVKCNDKNGLKIAIEDVLINYEKAVEMGKNAQILRKQLSVENIVIEWENFMNSILK